MKESQRSWFLYSFGFFKGASIASLVEYSLALHPQNVAIALVATSLIFGCFSLSVLFSNRRDSLYLTGALSSAVSILLWLSFANIFIRSSFLFSAELYLSLCVFAGYIVYDTQIMIEKAQRGSKDYLGHSMDLFVDFIAVFTRILILLERKNREKEKKRK